MYRSIVRRKAETSTNTIGDVQPAPQERGPDAEPVTANRIRATPAPIVSEADEQARLELMADACLDGQLSRDWFTGNKTPANWTAPRLHLAIGVTIGVLVGNDWLANSGLRSGDRLIIDGLRTVRHGAAAEPVSLQTVTADSRPEAANKEI